MAGEVHWLPVLVVAVPALAVVTALVATPEAEGEAASRRWSWWACGPTGRRS